MECGCVIAIYDGDYEPSAIFEAVVCRAREARLCEECGASIEVGDRYEMTTWLYAGSGWSHFASCLGCSRLAKDVYCHGRIFGMLAEDVWEHLGVDICTGETMIDEEEGY